MQLGIGELVPLLDPRLVCAVAARMLVAVSVGLMPVFPGVPWRLRGALGLLLTGAALPAAARAGLDAPSALAVVVAGEAHLAAGGDHGEVGGLPVGLRPVGPERADRRHDERRVQPGQLLGRQPQLRQATWTEGLDQDVGPGDERAELLAAVFVLEVEDHRALAPVVTPEEQRGLAVGPFPVDGERADPPGGRPARRFDQDHLGPEERQQLAGQLTAVVGQVENSVWSQHRATSR